MKSKICISICTETLEKLKEKLELIQTDVVEVRLDCLNEIPYETLKALIGKKQFIFTYRPKNQGGQTSVSRRERLAVLKKIAESINENSIIDCEFDLLPEANSFNCKKVISFHSFDSNTKNIEKIYSWIANDAEILKIAIFVNEATDAIDLWRILTVARNQGRKLIPIAMGEAGKWTRILGLAYGAYLTFASLDESETTAPGQISFSELRNVYRAEELDESSEVYGLLAGETAYSLSPYIHNIAFKYHNIKAVFVPFQVKNLGRFLSEMVFEKSRKIQLNLKGFAVTNPHKETIIPHLDEIDEKAKIIGAVNTVKIQNGKLIGFNTDEAGFIEPLLSIYGSLKNVRVAVIGAGGSARACIFALKNQGAKVKVFARNSEKAKRLAEDFEIEFAQIPDSKDESAFEGFDILINATPVGTKGLYEKASVVSATQLSKLQLVYDLVYNPLETKLLKEAERVNIPRISGLAMLIAQAAQQQKIWTGLEAPIKEMGQIAMMKLNNS